MKFVYLLLLSNLLIARLTAQDVACPLQPLCTYDLRTPIPGITLGFKENVVYSKEGIQTLPEQEKKKYIIDPVYIKEISCKSNPPPPQPKPTEDYCELIDQAMQFDVYYPQFTGSKNCTLPTVFIFHGGGYDECSGEDADVIKLICSTFVYRGFIAISCDYRAGRLLPVSNVNTTKTVQQQLAVGKATQDVLGAIASACKMEDDNKFNGDFHIDKSKIFVGGQSAGCGAVLCAVYLRTLSMLKAASPSIFEALGDTRRPDLYYAPPSYTLPVIRGVFNNWGEFPIPGDKITPELAYAFFTQGNPSKEKFHL